MQQNPEPIEAPLGGGFRTSPPSKEMLERLPLATEPNAGVGHHIPFRQIDGFTGITLGSEAAVGGNGTPPTQGLAVHDNIVAEIVNSSLQFFKSDGTSLTNPIRNSAFFLAEGFILVAPQVFFDPKSKRWYFLDNISPPGVFTGGIALAVSQTSDPLGMFYLPYSVDQRRFAWMRRDRLLARLSAWRLRRQRLLHQHEAVYLLPRLPCRAGRLCAAESSTRGRVQGRREPKCCPVRPRRRLFRATQRSRSA
jgi:hypothetical protein